MCNYIYKELSCEHFFYLVESWCPSYICTQRRCKPNIISMQYWGNDLCAACRDRHKPNTHPCAKLVRDGQRNCGSYKHIYAYDNIHYEYHASTGRVSAKAKVLKRPYSGSRLPLSPPPPSSSSSRGSMLSRRGSVRYQPARMHPMCMA